MKGYSGNFNTETNNSGVAKWFKDQGNFAFKIKNKAEIELNFLLHVQDFFNNEGYSFADVSMEDLIIYKTIAHISGMTSNILYTTGQEIELVEQAIEYLGAILGYAEDIY